MNLNLASFSIKRFSINRRIAKTYHIEPTKFCKNLSIIWVFHLYESQLTGFHFIRFNLYKYKSFHVVPNIIDRIHILILSWSFPIIDPPYCVQNFKLKH